MKKLIIAMTILTLFCIAPATWGYMESEHVWFIDQACKDDSLSQSKFWQECCAQQSWCEAGSLVPDIAVVDYFTQKGSNKLLGSNYKGTHSALFCRDMYDNSFTAQERAFSVGCGSGHLFMDSHGHNHVVPDYLKKVKQPNAIGHVFEELTLSNRFATPQMEAKARNAAGMIPDMLPLMERTLVGAATTDYDRQKLHDRVNFYVAQITGGQDMISFKLGWSTLWSLPITLILLLFAGLGLAIYGLYYFISRRFKSPIVKYVAMPVGLFASGLGVLVIGLLLYGLLSGQLWSIFNWISQSFTWAIPIENPQTIMSSAYDYSKQFFLLSDPYGWLTASTLRDPSGDTSLFLAESGFKSLITWLLVGVGIAIGVILLFKFRLLNARQRRKK